MNFEKLKKAAFESGIEDIELYQVISNAVSISVYNSEIDECGENQTNSLSIRGVYNGHIATVSLENDSDDEIDFVINSIKENASLINVDEPYFIYEGDSSYPALEEKKTNFEAFTLNDKKNLCFNLEKEIRNRSPYVVQTQTQYEEFEQVTNIMNSKGLNLTKKTNKGVVVGVAILSDGKEMKQSYDYQYFTDLNNMDLVKMSHDIVDREITTFGAQSIAANKYSVVVENTTFMDLLHVFSSLFSAEVVLKKMSMLDGKINEQIFGENITLIDDPLNNLSDYQTAFDDEGVSSKVKEIVSNGVLKTYLHNLKTASMMNTTSTGNGFKSAMSSNVDVTPSNFYLKPGNKSLDELFETMQNGIFITHLAGLHAGVSIISGDFNLQASGFEIVDGKIARPLTMIVFSGNVLHMLNNVEEIGNDFKFRNHFGSSSVLLNNMSVSGKE